MILTPAQTDRYYRLYDLLSTYAHHELKVVEDDEFFDPKGPRGISLAGQHETMSELWYCRSVIEDYVHENPDGLSNDDLSNVESWVDAYSAEFYIARKPGSPHDLYYLSQGFVFEVSGVLKETDEVLPYIPTLVHAALLPFEDRITTSLVIKYLEEPLSTKETERCDAELEHALAQNNLITTGQQLREVSDELTASAMGEAFQRLGDYLMEEYDALGISEEQRDAFLSALDERNDTLQEIAGNIAELDERIGSLSVKLMDRFCTSGPVATTLEEILDAYSQTENNSRRSLYATPHYRNDLIRHVTNVEEVQEDVGRMERADFDFLARLFAAGGRLHLDVTELTRMPDLPYPHAGIYHFFHDGNGYTAIVPDEVMPVLRQLDWEQAKRDVKRHEMLVRFFDAILELRGIVSYDKALDEYLALFPEDGRDGDDVSLELQYAIDSGESQACVLRAPEDDFLIHYDLLEAWRAETYGKDADNPDKIGLTSHDSGELGKLVSAYLERQAERKPRPVLHEMLATGHINDWKMELPASQSMYDFLRVNAPERGLEDQPASDVMGEFFAEARWGTPQESSDAFMDILDENGYRRLAERRDSVVPDLLSELYNSLPNWACNGWSLNEVDKHRPAKRLFFNPDGSIMNVGRNAPCPCGSGKKYKRCCGR